MSAKALNFTWLKRKIFHKYEYVIFFSKFDFLQKIQQFDGPCKQILSGMEWSVMEESIKTVWYPDYIYTLI